MKKMILTVIEKNSFNNNPVRRRLISQWKISWKCREARDKSRPYEPLSGQRDLNYAILKNRLRF